MKKLTRMKLINWHRFNNCTIDFGDSTLLSGENGAGKSTLLDAIQFVIICSASNFNKAAHENGKRKLSGYIRCKSGKENQPYQRTGEISAHVALEFYEESKDRYFILGAVVDSASEEQETTVRYLIENTRLSDDLFLYGNQVKSIAEFRASNIDIRQWCKTQVEARKMVTARLGRIEDKFFRLIPKALAFKPIDDIKDFVYSYVLDEKEVNIDVLRENVRTYQDMERTLDNVKKRMKKLENIESLYQRVQERIEKDKMYEYFLKRSNLDLVEGQLRSTDTAKKNEEIRLSQAQTQLEMLQKERNEKQEMATNIRVELRHNQEFVALEEEKKELARLWDKEKNALAEEAELKKSVVQAARNCEDLLKAVQEQSLHGENAGASVEDTDFLTCIREYRQQLQLLEKEGNTAQLRSLTDDVIHYKQKHFGELQGELARQQIELNQNRTELEKLNKKINKLNRKKLTYPSGVELLVETVREEFEHLGREIQPGILCEMLEIQDEEWRNAVEGYLNTQRFYVLVEPESFDIALGIYDRLRREKKVYGVGLINTRDLENYNTALAGTLATMVTSQNKYARQYCNMILGKVQMCEDYEDLKKYSISITKGCMRYQNRVASAIKPEVFKVPFIGKNAFKVQLAQAEEELKKLSEIIENQKSQQNKTMEILGLLSTECDVDIKYRLDVINTLRMVKKAISKCEENIRKLKENSTLIQKQIQLEELDKVLRGLEQSISSDTEKIGGMRTRIQDLIARKQALLEKQVTDKAAVISLGEEAGNILNSWNTEYEKALGTRPIEQFQSEYFYRQPSNKRKYNSDRCQIAKDAMVNAMVEYKTEHDFGAAATLEGFPEFAAVYERLKNSELLDYEEKVQSAREAAETEFHEQFLAKLQENMKLAQGEFKELNKALKGIDFSSERYEFQFMPSKKYRSYYEMIMDDFNVTQGESLFSGIFHEAHKDVIEELFERLSLSGENSAQTLDEFTDYRTYMDYDIKIIHNDGSYSYYSKVCEEKSGGETQTPFYVTVAASFVQLYSNNIGGEAAGLVLFDEAFNNMDDERIGGVLEFLRRLPLQLIIAAPPDKIQYIGPAMDEIMLVMTDQKRSYVEEYHNAV
ncbi:ATP-binding protein [Blautia sp. HCP3S3_H10_1]|uniref:ATP-binding protein n=1 Tax=unclassified Blautia TaxID=2648079 RepID=UPI003F8F53C9